MKDAKMRHGPENGGARITYQASNKEVGRREGRQPHWSLQRRQEGTDDGCSSEFRLMSSRGSVGSASCTWIDSRNSTYARAYMECSLGFYVLYYAPQRYRLGSYHLYFDKPLTRPLAGGGETRLARVLIPVIYFT